MSTIYTRRENDGQFIWFGHFTHRAESFDEQLGDTYQAAQTRFDEILRQGTQETEDIIPVELQRILL